MDDKLFDILDNLNIRDTKMLLDKEVDLSVDYFTRKRIEKSIKKKTGYYSGNNTLKNTINNILGGILMKKKIALALSVGIILSLAGGGYAYARTPVAYVSMDINPSVELGVNAFDKVVSVEAYNEDGKKILEGTDLINYNIDNAVSTVISNAISDGYIHDDGSSAIEITTSTDKEDVATKLEESLKNVADETLSNNDIEAEVATENVALLRRDEARKLGITPGKLNLIQKLQELDPSITVEEYKSSSVKDIQKKTKELRKNNKSDEITTDDSTNVGTVIEEKTKEGTSSQTSVDSEEATIIEPEKNNNSSNNKDNNSNVKKEENSNVNSKKEEKINASEEKNTTNTINEKQNNSNNTNAEEKSNSSKIEKNNNSDSESKGSSSKSDNNSNSNSNSQNKGKSKNN